MAMLDTLVMTTEADISSHYYSSDSMSSPDQLSRTSKPKRKRQRLDHLSQEEKLMRRKLKNRMAAQSARDRKKVRMQDLEEEVLLFSKQRNALLKQNETLKQRNASLEQQNKELNERLSLLESKPSIKAEENESHDWNETFESAVLISDPQPQEQVSHAVRQRLWAQRAQPLMTPFVFWLILKNLMLCSMFCTCIPKNCLTQTSTKKIANCSQSMRSNAANQYQWNSHHIWDQLKT